VSARENRASDTKPYWDALPDAMPTYQDESHNSLEIDALVKIFGLNLCGKSELKERDAH
jgi:hypothetical protein